MSATFYASDAWAELERDDARLRRIIGMVALPFVVLCILIPLWQLSGLEEGGGEPVSDRFAALLLEQAAQQEAPQPAPVPVAEPEPEPEAEQASDPEPEPEAQQETQPEPEPQPKVEPKKPQPTAPPVDRSIQAREKVQKQLAGALSALQDLQSEPVITANNRPLRQASASSSDAEVGSANVVSSNFSGGSGARVGDITRQESRNTSLGPRQSSNAGQQISASGGGFGPASDRPGSGGTRSAGRSLEEIQLIMDRNKGGLYAIYNRALRSNPALQGKLVLKLTIAPSGAVTACEVVSSELRDPDLENKVVARVKLINFGAKDVPALTLNYPIFFAPS